jgi:hypothetical protein
VSTIPLATVRATGPFGRAMLRCQLADLRLPPRSAALLAGAGLGGSEAPPDCAAMSDLAAIAAINAALGALVGCLAGGITDPISYHRAVARLVGLGPGLTPTGDDLLVALVAASRRLAMADVLPTAAADEFAAAVAALPAGLTTTVAHFLLSQAAEGRFPETLAAFVDALGDPAVDRETFARLLERLVATGAHSGADWLAGVVALARGSLQGRAEALPHRCERLRHRSEGGDAWPSA